MDKQLSTESHAKITAMCDQISSVAGYDADIQKELHAHMEDKALALLSGKEPLSEQDALLLVRKHFGNPREIKCLFQHVHTEKAGVTFLRRFAAVAVVGSAIGTLHWSIGSALNVFSIAFPDKITALPAFTWPMYSYGIQGLGLLALFFLLRFWKRRLASGSSPWFLGWSLPKVLVVAIGFVVFAAFVSGVPSDGLKE